MTTRRALLVSGSAAIVIASAGTWLSTRAPKQARMPWAVATESSGDVLLDFLGIALLAPNPHNMQPWLIERTGEFSFALFPNEKRLLPETDPPSRQITIGFGCFLEVFRMAAAQAGWQTRIDLFPEGSSADMLSPDQLVARVEIEQDPKVTSDPLYQQIFHRRTNRASFDPDQTVSMSDLQRIASAATKNQSAGFTNEPATVEELRSIALEAWDVEWNTPHTREESIKVTRIGKNETNNDPWGITLTDPFSSSLNKFGILTRAKMRTPGTLAYDETFKFYAAACETAEAFVWLTTENNDRLSQIATGASWVRMHLKATELGIAFHPLSQSLQEFPEMKDVYKRVHQLLAPNGDTVQMLSRLGYAKAPPPSAREALTAKLIAG